MKNVHIDEILSDVNEFGMVVEEHFRGDSPGPKMGSHAPDGLWYGRIRRLGECVPAQPASNPGPSSVRRLNEHTLHGRPQPRWSQEVAGRVAATDVADPDSLWWRHERLHRSVLRDPASLLAMFSDERDQVEMFWLTDPQEAAMAFAEADRLLDSWTARVAAASVHVSRPVWARRYWRVRNRRAGLAP